jgi:hypothetical protein
VKRSEHSCFAKSNKQSQANIFISKNNTIAKQNELGYSKTRQKRSEANWFILKLYKIEAKRTGSKVILYFKK